MHSRTHEISEPQEPVSGAERGRRVIGRSRDCDWQIDDNERRVSKLHCTLSRDGEGFTILDQSANGTLVDGRLLLEGESARLRDGSQINIGGQVFQVAISGDAEPGFFRSRCFPAHE